MRLLPRLLFLACLSLPVSAVAEPAPAEKGWESVGTSAAPVGETIPAARLVAAAYAFIWLAVLGLVVSLWWRTAAVEREIADLRRRIPAPPTTERPSAGPGSGPPSPG
jgi:hypothetical protein